MAGRERPHPERDGGGKRRRGTLMRILSRYVFRQTAGALLLILLSLTGVVWIAVALRQLELMTTQGQDVLRFLAMTTLAIPSMMALIAPIALLIASIHVLNRLSGDSELIVMTAGGMPAWSLLKPLALLALLTALGVSAVNHLAGPWAQRKLKELAMQVRTDLMAQVIQPWRFTSPEAKLTVHIRDRAPNGELLGLMMHDARDPKQIVTYLAERGRIIKQGGPSLSAHGQGPYRAPPGERAGAADHRLRPLRGGLPTSSSSAPTRPTSCGRASASRPSCCAPIPDDPIYKANPGELSPPSCTSGSRAPFYAFAFVLVVLAFMGQAQTTRTSRMQAVIAAFALAVLARILGITAPTWWSCARRRRRCSMRCRPPRPCWPR